MSKHAISSIRITNDVCVAVQRDRPPGPTKRVYLSLRESRNTSVNKKNKKKGKRRCYRTNWRDREEKKEICNSMFRYNCMPG